MKYIIFFAFICQLFSCAWPTDAPIVDRQDYIDLFNMPRAVQVNNDSNINFWQEKIKQSPNAYLFEQKLAGTYLDKFEENGDIRMLHQSNKYLTNSLSSVPNKHKSNALLMLSGNAVKLHQFKNALDYAQQAELYTKDTYPCHLMQFDALMELGSTKEAHELLKKNARWNSFDYLVRYAKYQDHIGQLDSAIYHMEQAFTTTSNRSQQLWLTAALGDFYGHAGDLHKSYNAYLEVVKADPTNIHALEGIAWIAFSHDKNINAALEILHHIRTMTDLPGSLLDIAEIHEFDGQHQKASTITSEFIKEAVDTQYMGMYDGYLIDLLAPAQPTEAMKYAVREVSARPTAASYTNLAWVHHYQNQYSEAANIIKEYVLEQTFEPALLYKSAVILAANKEMDMASVLIEECKEAAFELGPVVSQKIQKF